MINKVEGVNREGSKGGDGMEARIEALRPFMELGERYTRGVREAVRDAREAEARGSVKAAEYFLRQAESFAGLRDWRSVNEAFS